MMPGLLYLGLLVLIVAPVTLTITKAGIFAPLRNFIASKSKWLGELARCPYCMSHWVSLGTVVLFKPVVLDDWAPNLLFCVFSLVSVSSWVMWAVFTAHSGMSGNDAEE